MFRFKSNRNAFAIAVVIILLCLVCLVGATFALFTSSTEDGTIGVITAAGDVKVDIVDADTHESLIGSFLKFVDANGEDGVLFEPGSTFRTTAFNIENEGTVPINFRLYVSRDSRYDMTAFDEAFEVWISDDSEAMDGGLTLPQFVDSLAANTVGDTDYYLFVKMKEDVTDTSFQGQEFNGIGVTVWAVQGNVTIGEDR